jgi:hypothetical protein
MDKKTKNGAEINEADELFTLPCLPLYQLLPKSDLTSVVAKRNLTWRI